MFAFVTNAWDAVCRRVKYNNTVVLPDTLYKETSMAWYIHRSAIAELKLADYVQGKKAGTLRFRKSGDAERFQHFIETYV